MVYKEVIELKEFQSLYLPQSSISKEVSEIIKIKFNKQVQISPPWFGTDYRWLLASQGWVGFIPVTQNFGLSLLPKVPLKNLFGLLSYAYKLKNILFIDGQFEANSIQEFYDYLALKLSKLILNRGRKGLFREYVSKDDNLPFIRGRINLRDVVNYPWRIKLNSNYRDHTADVEFNQILSYSLNIILRSGLCSKSVLPTIRSAHRLMSRYSRPIPFTPRESISFFYNRLNQDYWPMHILCRFFLEHLGPQINIGDYTMLPFLVDMWQLFELFVFEWLKEHLPKEYVITKQEKFFLSDNNDLYFKADLVISEKSSGNVKFVLDTKYKDQPSPDPGDLAQVIAYAQTRGAIEAILVYPINLKSPFNGKSGNINLHCLSFNIEDDLEEAGRLFLGQLLSFSH